MQFEYDPEKLIEEVKKRPGIWDYEHPDYRAKNLRYKLWNEVVNELMQTDVKMSKSEMRELEIQLQKKWKSIRDCFQKYIINPKRTKRPYIYSKQLQFLLKDQELPRRETVWRAEQDRRSVEGSSESDEALNLKPKKIWKPKKKLKIVKDEEASSEEDNNSTMDVQEDSRDYSNDDNSARHVKSAKTNKSHVVDSEFAFASVDSQSKSDADDADRLFLLSLLPHLKTIPEEFRLNVKMELMQVLRTANFSTAREHKLI